MLEAAAEAVGDSGLKLLAVTVLTSHDDRELFEIGLPRERSSRRDWLDLRAIAVSMDSSVNSFS